MTIKLNNRQLKIIWTWCEENENTYIAKLYMQSCSVNGALLNFHDFLDCKQINKACKKSDDIFKRYALTYKSTHNLRDVIGAEILLIIRPKPLSLTPKDYHIRNIRIARDAVNSFTFVEIGRQENLSPYRCRQVTIKILKQVKQEDSPCGVYRILEVRKNKDYWLNRIDKLS